MRHGKKKKNYTINIYLYFMAIVFQSGPLEMHHMTVYRSIASEISHIAYVKPVDSYYKLI